MHLLLVESAAAIDIAALEALAARAPELHIDIFESVQALLSPREIDAGCIILVAEALLAAETPRNLRQVLLLRERGALLVSGRTAELLPLCAAIATAAATADVPPPAAAEGAAAHPLSERETEILLLLSDGLQNKQIARQLNLSVSTVKTHVANLFRKIGATNRLDAICRFAEARGERPVPAAPAQLARLSPWPTARLSRWAA